MNCIGTFLEFSKSGGRCTFSQWAYVAKYSVNRIKRKWRGILLRFWPSNQTHLRVWKHPQGDSLCHCETQQRREPYTCQQFVSASVSGLEQWHGEPRASCARDAGSALALLLVCQQSSVKSSHQLAPQVSRKLTRSEETHTATASFPVYTTALSLPHKKAPSWSPAAILCLGPVRTVGDWNRMGFSKHMVESHYVPFDSEKFHYCLS